MIAPQLILFSDSHFYSTCYGLTAGEVCPNKYKFLAVVLVVVPIVIPTGFGAYLALLLTHTANWR